MSNEKDILDKIVDYENKLDKFFEENTVKIDPQQRKEWHKAAEIMELLDIPCNTGGITPPSIPATKLYEIFMDEKKCQELISKLRNKAFW